MGYYMKIAILGWGSLLWDTRPCFDKQHGDWQSDGPILNLEFSRVSDSRNAALTLVLDNKNGTPCKVSYVFSKRKNPDDAICDLRCREETTLANIGFYFADNSRKYNKNELTIKTIKDWAEAKSIDVVIWTDLVNNFEEKSKFKLPFSIKAAFSHLQALDCEGKKMAWEYISRAPEFIKTPLREALQSQAWFQELHIKHN